MVGFLTGFGLVGNVAFSGWGIGFVWDPLGGYGTRFASRMDFSVLRIPKYRASPWVFGLMGILPCGGTLSAMCAGEENRYDPIEL